MLCLQEKTGRIDYHELKVAIRALGFDIKKAEALRLVEEHDVQGTGTIGRDDFVTILTAKYASRDPHEELRKAFELFDAVCSSFSSSTGQHLLIIVTNVLASGKLQTHMFSLCLLSGLHWTDLDQEHACYCPRAR